MCGIVGFISNETHNLSKNTEAIKHRGPDANGFFYTTIKHHKLGFGQVRLSIVDVTSAANQPFHSHDENFIIIFNGEIYNYRDIKVDLFSKGYCFSTNSDTEVLLTAYIEYGTDVVNYLDGMFAFAIYDKVNNHLFCARDHLGIKPFYFYLNLEDQCFFFASELSALFQFPIKKRIDSNSVTEFFFNGWLYEPNTGFEDVYKLQPGEYIKIGLNDFSVEKNFYFDIAQSHEITTPTKTIESLICDSLDLQSYNEVKLGNFFSGGIDSTIIASFLGKKLEHLSMQYNSNKLCSLELEDDAFYASKIGQYLNLDINYIEMQEKLSAIQKIEYVARNCGDLVSDFTFLATEEISKEAAKRGYKVMLSGMGADELFGGYPRYKVVHFKKFYKIVGLLLKPFYPMLKKNLFLTKKIDRFYSYFAAQTFGIAYYQLVGYFSLEEIKKLVKNQPSISVYEEKLQKILLKVESFSSLKKAMYLDIYGFLSHNFLVSDIASMRASIELRVPLATKEILSNNFYTKDSELINWRKTKIQLRKILYTFLPRRLIDRKKTGFNPPIDEMIWQIGKDEILSLLENSKINLYLEKNEIQNIILNHFEHIHNNTYKIWQLLYFHFWVNHNLMINEDAKNCI